MDRLTRRLIIALTLLLGALGGAGAATPTITTPTTRMEVGE